jgi:ATP-dependent Lon protease
MRDFRDAKAMAQTLKSKSVSLTHSESLELVARTLGFPDWNYLAARIQSSEPRPASSGATLPAAASSVVSPRIAIPIVPMRDLVMFPQMVAPIFVGREKSRRAIERAIGDGLPAVPAHAAARRRR